MPSNKGDGAVAASLHQRGCLESPSSLPVGGAASASPDPSHIWLPELVQRYARSLSCNEVACTLRLVNKATAAQFRGPQDRTVRLSLPVPHHAFVQRWRAMGALRGLTVIQREQLSWLTACSGSIANLEVLLAREDCACCLDALRAAAAGSVPLAPAAGLPLGLYGPQRSSGGGGHQDVCEWLLASGCPWSDWAAGRAARGGHVGLMDWLLGTGHVSPSKGLVEDAAAGCDLPTLQRLHSTHFTQQLGEAFKERVMAAAAGSLTADWRAKVEWLEGQGFPRTAEACVQAVKQPNGRGRLEWLQQRGYPLDGGVAVAAAEVGVVDALQYVLESGVALDQRTIGMAAREAARRGQLAVVQALHARAFDVAVAATAAAERGHLPVVAWLVEALGAANVLSAAVIRSAAVSGSMELLAWLVEALGTEKVLLAKVFASAARSGNMELLAWLHDRGCPWDESVFAAAAEAGCEEQLEWLAARGCPMPGAGAALASPDPSRIWLPELVQRYARSLSRNEVACALRLVNKATAAQFRGPQDRTVRLSLRVPHHAFVQRWGGVGAMRSLTLSQRRQLPCLTARSGSITNLKVLLLGDNLSGVVDKDEVLAVAAGAGQLKVCRWLCQYQRYPPDNGVIRALLAAARGGQQAVCEWLLDIGCPWGEEAPAEAARGGHVGLMDWLLGRDWLQGPEALVGKGLLAGTAAGCDLPTLQRLHQTHQLYDNISKEAVMASAAGSLTADWHAKVEWLEGRGYPRTAKAFAEAVKQPDWRTRLKWLQQRGYPLNGYIAVVAASVGAMDALQYVLELGVTLDERTALHARGFDIAGAATAAAGRGHLPVVAWLVETLGANKVLSAQLFASATRPGKIELLAWLHDRGCPLDKSVFVAAVEAGCEEQLEWLAARSCPMPEDGEAYARPACNDDLATLKCLLRLGCSLGPDGRAFTCALENIWYSRAGTTSNGRRDSAWWVAAEAGLQHGLPWLLEQLGPHVDWDAVELMGRTASSEVDEDIKAWKSELLDRVYEMREAA
ncbi:hypothetical protein TSOC_002643 [Tetrabaena socialis]|uniref:Ankyrin repeat domain-containing protein n=1 Tax=Tetrabaena socialis TaxID=47790 RepID=A0A2J8ADL9_9CHLO|nr:hypothetical protein TSOC_002643 [Tetrabaena socialis]|eukprot:PNH10618.1 hypothetical protein TSOC_002643 [Tetrabaena socialis]